MGSHSCYPDHSNSYVRDDFCRNSGGNAALRIFPSDSLLLFSFRMLLPHNSVLVDPKKTVEGIIANPIHNKRSTSQF